MINLFVEVYITLHLLLDGSSEVKEEKSTTPPIDTMPIDESEFETVEEEIIKPPENPPDVSYFSEN